MVDRQPSAHTRTRRRAIYFALREDAHVAAMGGRASRHPMHEDRPVQEIEIRIAAWMDDLIARHDRPLDPHPGVDQLLLVFRRNLQAKRIGIYVGVKCAAKGQVILHVTESRYIYALISGQQK